jgi:hypothetical protein
MPSADQEERIERGVMFHWMDASGWFWMSFMMVV